jgi:hypothetical protein
LLAGRRLLDLLEVLYDALAYPAQVLARIAKRRLDVGQELA